MGDKAKVEINVVKVRVTCACCIWEHVFIVSSSHVGRIPFVSLLHLHMQPGKGNFVVKVSGCKKPIVELLGLKRPFPALKELDMEVVTAQVLKALDS